ncbi:MAG: glycosyltransferase family protein [Patescibacteria group bacterium]
MRIIYSLSGQGFGHSARSKETIKHLIDRGHEVRIFTYGQSLLLLEKHFGADRIFEIPGLVLSYKKNKLVYWKTVWENGKKVFCQARDWKKICRAFDDFQPDLVITDFEPLGARLAKRKNKPLISIDNQHQLTKTEIDLPAKYQKDLLADKLVIKSMIRGARFYLITSFFKTPITGKNTFLFAPIIRQEILDLKPAAGDYVLVYQGADFDRLIPLLKNRPEKFVIFGPHQPSLDGNLTYRGFAVQEWLDYLAGAKAVIGTAGLSLICECIYLKKPYLAIPIGRQIEQTINAEYLERLGYGLAAHDLTKQKLADFLEHLPEYEKNLATAEALGNEALFAKLDEIIAELKK